VLFYKENIVCFFRIIGKINKFALWFFKVSDVARHFYSGVSTVPSHNGQFGASGA